jgi:ammonia channel protein AmtB
MGGGWLARLRVQDFAGGIVVHTTAGVSALILAILIGPRRGFPQALIRDLIEAQRAVPNIPPKSNRKWKPCFGRALNRERNLVERFFSKLKHFRRIATRYDKLAGNFLAMVQLASIRLWLRAYESTTKAIRIESEILLHTWRAALSSRKGTYL